MKTTKWMIPAVLAAALLAGCGSSSTTATTEETADTGSAAAAAVTDTGSGAAAESTESVELNVFAAASMQETLTQLADDYMADNPNVTITLNLDSSGTLETQIKEGAACDIFISAAQKQMNELDATSDAEVNTDGSDYVDTDTRIDILENKVVLVVPEGNPKGITSFEDIASKADLVALGNEDVPVGQYSEEILTNLGVLEELENAQKITYGSNVKEVTTQVSEGVADCGIVYATDAYSAGLESVAEADETMCKQVIYPAAVLKTSENADAAKAFLQYLTEDHADEVFESVGFKTVD